MGINPVSASAPETRTEPATAYPQAAPQQQADGAGLKSAPDPGTDPKPEVGRPQSTPALSELPQDEVQLQRDSEANGDVVVKYVDRSGNLILQVPSSEVLGLARSIGEDFQQHAKARAADAETRSEGGKPYGD